MNTKKKLEEEQSIRLKDQERREKEVQDKLEKMELDEKKI